MRADITELKRPEAQIEHLALLTTKEGKNLTKRQAQVLHKLAGGHTNKAIAEHLGLSIHTVRFHVSAVLRALDVSNRSEAALIARDLLR